MCNKHLPYDSNKVLIFLKRFYCHSKLVAWTMQYCVVEEWIRKRNEINAPKTQFSLKKCEECWLAYIYNKMCVILQEISWVIETFLFSSSYNVIFVFSKLKFLH